MWDTRKFIEELINTNFQVLQSSDQKKAIEKYKWDESKKAGKDLGQACILDWIKKYAKKFRKKWVEKDLKAALKELLIMKKRARGKESEIKCLKILNDIIEETEEALELLEKNGD